MVPCPSRMTHMMTSNTTKSYQSLDMALNSTWWVILMWFCGTNHSEGTKSFESSCKNASYIKQTWCSQGLSRLMLCHSTCYREAPISLKLCQEMPGPKLRPGTLYHHRSPSLHLQDEKKLPFPQSSKRFWKQTWICIDSQHHSTYPIAVNLQAIANSMENGSQFSTRRGGLTSKD